MKFIKQSLALLSALLLLTACASQSETPKEDAEASKKKIGILLVNHGSHSPKWREMLVDVETAVKERILSNEKITAIKTAHMEYTEPSIATRLKEFDEEQFDEIVVVPIFLTVSSHYSHDIPVICGISSDPAILESLEKEGIETYRPKAKVTITPPLDFTNILKKNVERRALALSKDAENEAILLVAYGDQQYNQQWEELVEDLGQYLKIKTGHESIAYAWCGHLVHYSTEPTKEGIAKLQELEENVIVIPVLVANDPYFQKDIIQKAVDESSNNEHIYYVQDAILPDDNLNQWVIDIANETVNKL